MDNRNAEKGLTIVIPVYNEAGDDVLSKVKTFKYCVMSEFILRAHLAGYKIREIPVRHYPRKEGAASIFDPEKLPLIIMGLIKNLLDIRFSGLKEKGAGDV